MLSANRRIERYSCNYAFTTDVTGKQVFEPALIVKKTRNVHKYPDPGYFDTIAEADVEVKVYRGIKQANGEITYFAKPGATFHFHEKRSKDDPSSKYDMADENRDPEERALTANIDFNEDGVADPASFTQIGTTQGLKSTLAFSLTDAQLEQLRRKYNLEFKRTGNSDYMLFFSRATADFNFDNIQDQVIVAKITPPSPKVGYTISNTVYLSSRSGKSIKFKG